ncbi:MFS transporter [Streptomyces sp. NPDC054842]
MTPHRLLVLTSSVAGAAIVALDGTVLTIAQPTLRRDLGASFAQVQWTSTGYLIAVAALLVFSGRLGDRYGHQRVFATGVLGFGATSAGIGLSSGIGWVIGLRVAQGVFGALLQPATLGMLRAAFPPDRLGMPVALRTSAIGVAAAAGPLVGGVLVTHLGWRAVFFLNVAPALVLGVLALVVRDPARTRALSAPGATEDGAPGTGTDPTPLDVPGACLLAAALALLVHTLVGASTGSGATGTALGLLAVLVLAAVFVRHERRTEGPLLPAEIVGSATIGAALGILVTASAAMVGALFAGTYFLQDVLGLDPLQSSLRALPGPVMMILGAPAAAVLMRRVGARRTCVAGTALLTAGVFALSRLGPGAAAPEIGFGFLLLGAGFGTVMVTATAVVVRQASAASAGVAGGLQQTAMNVGPTVGVAVATTLMTHAGVEMGLALTVLAAVSALGLPLARALPGRPAATPATAPPAAPEARPEPQAGKGP